MIIRAILLDVDGVLTDGKLYLDDRGREFKRFDTKDGHGMKMALAAGLEIAWISGRTSGATLVRARELGIAHVRQGVADKKAEAEALIRKWGLHPEEVAACGDDLPDLGLFAASGLSTCPADAVPGVRKCADLVLKSRGGDGVVRELVDEILRGNARVSGRSSGRASPVPSRASRKRRSSPA